MRCVLLCAFLWVAMQASYWKRAVCPRISPSPNLVSGHWHDSLDLGKIILEHFVDNFVDSARSVVNTNPLIRLHAKSLNGSGEECIQKAVGGSAPAATARTSRTSSSARSRSSRRLGPSPPWPAPTLATTREARA